MTETTRMIPAPTNDNRPKRRWGRRAGRGAGLFALYVVLCLALGSGLGYMRTWHSGDLSDMAMPADDEDGDALYACNREREEMRAALKSSAFWQERYRKNWGDEKQRVANIDEEARRLRVAVATKPPPTCEPAPAGAPAAATAATIAAGAERSPPDKAGAAEIETGALPSPGPTLHRQEGWHPPGPPVGALEYDALGLLAAPPGADAPTAAGAPAAVDAPAVVEAPAVVAAPILPVAPPAPGVSDPKTSPAVTVVATAPAEKRKQRRARIKSAPCPWWGCW